MGDRLVTIDMSRKLGACPFWWGRPWPHLTQCRLSEVYLHTKRHLDPSSLLATTIDMGRKLGVPLFGERELGPHLTQCGRGWSLPASQLSSWSVLTVWQQYTNVTYRTGQTRQRSDSIGRTVFAARRSYASAVLGVVILSVRQSVCSFVCHTRALW